MDNLPDELLTKVLGRVKYSFEQYKTLGQVNQKFDAIVGSAAYRIEVARNQFPELTALLDLKTLTEQELERLAKRDWNAVKLVEKIALGSKSIASTTNILALISGAIGQNSKADTILRR